MKLTQQGVDAQKRILYCAEVRRLRSEQEKQQQFAIYDRIGRTSQVAAVQ